MGLEPRSGAMKGFRSKVSSPDCLFRVETGVVSCYEKSEIPFGKSPFT
jgi:hypothetical protein